jgi:hypothetical protein
VIENHKSNAIRSHINKICKNPNENYQILKKLFINSDSYEDEETSSFKSENLSFDEQNRISYNIDGLFNNNIICNTSNEEAILILFMYTYLRNVVALSRANDSYCNRIELEHIFPKAWRGNWENKKYTAEEVKILLNNKKDSYESNSIRIEGIISDIDRCEFELKPYTNKNKPTKQEYSLIEWIGNKLCLHKTGNASIKDFSFTRKKEVYFDNQSFIVPNSLVSDNLATLNDFRAEEIVERTLDIANTIVENLFTTDWEGRKIS